jgi:hypothetical protein
MLQMHCEITPGGVEEVLRLIATSGDQLDLQALADKFVTGWPVWIGVAHALLG